ncbi:MAG TPA: hypothetical protein VND94_18740 [Terriglobia bacterium]|nr:hypothetical protein [Terriglobia bacterium]
MELMAPRVGSESAWQIISSLWSDDLTAVAEAKYQHSPQHPVLITAEDLRATRH